MSVPSARNARWATARRSEIGTTPRSAPKPKPCVNRHGQPHPGERPRPSAERDGVQVVQGNTRLGEQVVDHRKNALSMATLHFDFA